MSSSSTDGARTTEKSLRILTILHRRRSSALEVIITLFPPMVHILCIAVFSPLHWEEDDLSVGDSRMSRIVRVMFSITIINELY